MHLGTKHHPKLRKSLWQFVVSSHTMRYILYKEELWAENITKDKATKTTCVTKAF